MEPTALHTDQHLLHRIAQGDDQAFTILFNRYRSPLFDYALKITHTTAAAEELVQDTFLRIWLYRARLPAIEQPASYIHTMIRKSSIDWLRKLARDRKLQHTIAATITAGSETTLEDVQAGETRRLISEAIDQLAPQQREVFLLSRYEGLSYHEIAEQMSISSHTVRNHLAAALKSIRHYLANEYGPAVVLVIMTFLDKH